jgi:hypothetical protein
MSSDSYELNDVGTKEVLWCCNRCNVWWISQPMGAFQTWRLIPLVELADVPSQRNRPPAWQVCGPDPSVCPECGMTMSRQRLATQEIPTPYVALHN